MSRARAIALTIAVIGCQGRRAAEQTAPPSASPFVVPTVAPVSDAERTQIEDLALSYLAAMSAKDCATLQKIVHAYRSADCKADVDEWVEHATTFVAIESMTRDGRDPKAVLVSARMRVSGKERPMIVRVEPSDGGWKVHK